MKLRLVLAVLITAVSGAVLAVPPVGAAAPSLTVTWPEATRFNPDLTDYTIGIETPADEISVYIFNPRVGSFFIETPPSRQVLVGFPADGEWMVSVNVYSEGGHSSEERSVEVYRDLPVVVSERQLDFGPQRDADIRVNVPGPTGLTADLEWTLVPDGQPDVVAASGSGTVATGTETFSRLRGLRLPADSPDGRYVLEVRLTSQSEDFGLLEGQASSRALWDAQAPEPIAFTLSGADINPARDGYRDSVKLKLASGPGRNELFVRVINAGGQVADEYPVGARGRLTSTFNGWSGGKPLPAGAYTVQVVTIDAAGNEAIRSLPIRLHAERLIWQEVGRTFKASKLVVERYVGRCGSLVKSPKGRPKGALGYYSNAKCGNSREGTVATVLGVRLPVAYEGRYRDFRVTLVGGAARSARESRAQLAYYEPARKRYRHRGTLTSKQGRHRGHLFGNADDMVLDPTTSPAVYWSIGVGGGDRYEISTFTVEMKRQVLALPSSVRRMSRTASDANTIAEPSGAPGPG
jgi:hypothetical protein